MSCDKNVEKSIVDAFLGLDVTNLIDADVQSMSRPDIERWREAIPDLGFSVPDQEMNGGEVIGGKDMQQWRENNPDMEADLKFWRQTRPDTRFRCLTSTLCPNPELFEETADKLDIPDPSDKMLPDLLKLEQVVPTNKEEGVLGLHGLRKLSESLEEGKDGIYDEKDFLVDKEGQNEMDVLYHIELLLKDEESDEVKNDLPEELDNVKTDIPEEWNSPFPSPPMLETDPYFFNSNAYVPVSHDPSSFQSPQSSFSSSPSVQSEYPVPPNFVGSCPEYPPKFSSPYLDVPNRPSRSISYGFPPSPQHSYTNTIGSQRAPDYNEIGSCPSVMYPPPPFYNPALKRWDAIPVDICRQNSIPETTQPKRGLDFPIYVHPTGSQRSINRAMVSSSINRAINRDIPRFNPVKKSAPVTKYSSASKKLISNVTKQMCGFCKQNGERKEVYHSHSLGAPGNVTCPMLASHVCETCGSTGENAHTKTYCPKLRNDEGLHVPLPVVLKKTPRKSDGKLRKS